MDKRAKSCWTYRLGGGILLALCREVKSLTDHNTKHSIIGKKKYLILFSMLFGQKSLKKAWLTLLIR